MKLRIAKVANLTYIIQKKGLIFWTLAFDRTFLTVAEARRFLMNYRAPSKVPKGPVLETWEV